MLRSNRYLNGMPIDECDHNNDIHGDARNISHNNIIISGDGNSISGISQRMPYTKAAEIAETAEKISKSVEPIHDDLNNLNDKLTESYNQIHILRKELSEERERRIELEKIAEQAEKEKIKADQRFQLLLVILSVVLTLAFTALLIYLGVGLS